MTAGMGVPFSKWAGIQYVLEVGRVEDADARSLVERLVGNAFEAIKADDREQDEKEQFWNKQIERFAMEWRAKGEKFRPAYDFALGQHFILPPDDPAEIRALKMIKICPLWPFC